MASLKPKITQNDDGTLHYEFPAGVTAVITGPIQGHVTLQDGTVVNVSAPIVGVASDEHAAEVAHLIGQRYEAEGHPDHTEDVPFKYVASEMKG